MIDLPSKCVGVSFMGMLVLIAMLSFPRKLWRMLEDRRMFKNRDLFNRALFLLIVTNIYGIYDLVKHEKDRACIFFYSEMDILFNTGKLCNFTLYLILGGENRLREHVLYWHKEQ